MSLSNFSFDNIYLGDAYQLIKMVPDKSIDLIVTDPPYLINGVPGCRSGLFKGRSTSYVDEISPFVGGIDSSILYEFIRVLKAINLYIWCNKEQIYSYLDFFVRGYDCTFDVFVWCKTNPPPFTSNHYLKDKEYCLFFRSKGVKCHPVYSTGRSFYVSECDLRDKELYGHPTIKPSCVIDNFILNSSYDGSIVFDPFSGSGTTCVCAKRLKRSFLGFEIDPVYYSRSIDRLNGVDCLDRAAESRGQLKLF